MIASRSIVFLAVFVFGIAATIKRPFYGLLLYVILVYVDPSTKWWGSVFIPLRVSLVTAIVIFLSYFLNREKEGIPGRPVLLNKLMILFLGSIIISTILGKVILQANIDNIVIRYAKYIVLFFLITKVVKTKKDYDLLLWANIVGCLYLGVQAYIGAGHYENGRLEGIGGSGFQESEGVAAYICVVLPFLLDRYFAPSKKPWLTKASVLLCTAFILRLLVATKTRAAFLAILIMSLLLVIRMWKLGNVYKYIFVFVVGIAGMIYLADDHYWDRIGTIFSQSEALVDSNKGEVTEERIDVWAAGVRIMLENPMTGIGPGNFLIFGHEYLPDIDRKIAAHNMFVLTGSENGIPGLVILLGIVGSTLFLLRNIRSKQMVSLEDKSIHDSSVFLELSFIGFIVNGFFVNAIYFEVFFWLCGMAVALHNISHYHKHQELLIRLLEEQETCHA